MRSVNPERHGRSRIVASSDRSRPAPNGWHQDLEGRMRDHLPSLPGSIVGPCQCRTHPRRKGDWRHSREFCAATQGPRGSYSQIVAPWRILVSLIGIACLGILAGCAASPWPAPADQARTEQAIAVVPARYPPALGFGFLEPRAPLSTKELGLTLALGAGASLGAIALALAATAVAPLAAPMAGQMLVMGVLGLAGTGAIAVGAVSGAPAEDPRAVIAQPLSPALSGPSLSELSAGTAARNAATVTPFRAEVIEDLGPMAVDEVPDYRSLHDRGFDSALEIGVSRVGFVGSPSENVSIFVKGTARLIDTQTNRATWTKALLYVSPARQASGWLSDQAAPARTELERAARTLGERAVDALLLETESAVWLTTETCGLATVEPAPQWDAVPMGGTRSQRTLAGASPVASTTPLLAWEAAPAGPPLLPSPWGAARDIRYDLRVWSVEDGVPAEIVYERLGLTDTRHRVETALAPGSLYFWSVRLRGTIDGKPRATVWSMASNPAFPTVVPSGRAAGDASPPMCSGHECGCLDFIPAANFFRFRTP